MKKKLISLLISIILIPFLWSQETEPVNEEETQTNTVHEFTKADSFTGFIHSLDFLFQLEPAVYLNTEDKQVSAPSPIIYPLSIGILWPNYTKIAVQPTLGFFSTEWLYYDGMALPAEIENRTATSLSFIFTLPIVVSMYFKHSRLQILPGISLLAQFALLSNGVKADDSGYSGSAGNDVKLINQYFWSDIRFLYISIGGSWLFNILKTPNSWVKAGPVINVQIPLGHLTAGSGMQGTIISAGLKISL